jgi:hypothetical protein
MAEYNTIKKMIDNSFFNMLIMDTDYGLYGTLGKSPKNKMAEREGFRQVVSP